MNLANTDKDDDKRIFFFIKCVKKIYLRNRKVSAVNN